MLKLTKLSLDQEILLCIVTMFAFVFVENPCDYWYLVQQTAENSILEWSLTGNTICDS